MKEKLNKVLTGRSVKGTVEAYNPAPLNVPDMDTVGEIVASSEDEDTLQYFAKLADKQ